MLSISCQMLVIVVICLESAVLCYFIIISASPRARARLSSPFSLVKFYLLPSSCLNSAESLLPFTLRCLFRNRSPVHLAHMSDRVNQSQAVIEQYFLVAPFYF